MCALNIVQRKRVHFSTALALQENNAMLSFIKALCKDDIFRSKTDPWQVYVFSKDLALVYRTM